ncbi:DNA repair protein RecO [Parahaliea aestuarii]|uniref:DNA repair protein RecO n=1 Tax=Parahaliea aestuarii TaxID=1852021 RepID=A0A5C8ZV19_9GAMM|nr:DNA repair protein RecO [Parahaliea aestuarii]TXS91430.1 DNA repair protein RecO [Parahaliea aestuarii]
MRVSLQPAYLLHSRPYRDSSQLLEVFTAEHGCVSLVGRGVHRRARGGSLRANLQPFRPLLVSFSGRSELQSLNAVESAGAGVQLAGERLFSGLYLNELLLRLLHRHDPHPTLFAGYASALDQLAAAAHSEPVLRAFELQLLDELGYGFDPAEDAHSHQSVREDGWYRYSDGLGLVACAPDAGAPGQRFPGSDLLAIARGEFSGAAAGSAKRLLRMVIAGHLGGRPLHTRDLFRQYRQGGTAGGEGES